MGSKFLPTIFLGVVILEEEAIKGICPQCNKEVHSDKLYVLTQTPEGILYYHFSCYNEVKANEQEDNG